MQHLRASNVWVYKAQDGSIEIHEFNFQQSDINDALITLASRYPTHGFAINDKSTAIVSIEDGDGSLVMKDQSTIKLIQGDRIRIEPGEPYYFEVTDKLVIRYIGFDPAWTKEQARNIE